MWQKEKFKPLLEFMPSPPHTEHNFFLKKKLAEQPTLIPGCDLQVYVLFNYNIPSSAPTDFTKILRMQLSSPGFHTKPDSVTN